MLTGVAQVRNLFTEQETQCGRRLPQPLNPARRTVLDPEEPDHLANVADLDVRIRPPSMRPQRQSVEDVAAVGDDPVVLPLPFCVARSARIQHRPDIAERYRAERGHG